MQKEQLSALMDGETVDNELISALSGDIALQKDWESYHLIRDTLCGDIPARLDFDLAARVAAAIEAEPAKNITQLIPEAQPVPEQAAAAMPFWAKVRPWAAQITQIGVAACVSLAVIVGVQQYNRPVAVQSSDAPVFNTLPMMGQASPVSLGVPADNANAAATSANQQVQDQRRRVNAMLQDYELQRRLNAQQLQLESPNQQQAAAQVPGNQSLGMQSQ
ncbi:anti-sigma-E factor RseA [Erwinia pyrifoliae]|uniref:Anti-sigma-E factor RseA n=1 Tax=Erwinia pyrifoliae TaxID=79967 RepID=A0ABY5XAZ2_ERWPY|nr:anti-sigma-E factor RseA [Erwinia pyrifoliae]AUX73446.1 anti-sigma-E factor RseA [Erwinia pyrifoliae]MCA8876255.1 anti-sigma-E factor RseA [Erwinia pyrifoliae]UWS28414.1 anti-sigma-E factor RseA [Erwinia pyrifoliae]UWS34377.1 anti-sigma-E factor RseA [Erwinia pyrifoliae]UXK11411.1 anti-sigma-E factor RseA [Erwinia pyrifoliae]